MHARSDSQQGAGPGLEGGPLAPCQPKWSSHQGHPSSGLSKLWAPKKVSPSYSRGARTLDYLARVRTGHMEVGSTVVKGKLRRR